MEFFATCPKGFEHLLADELAFLGCKRVRPLRGQVSFEGEVRDAYRACLWSRLASRVVLVITRVDATDSDALYEGLAAIAWEEHLGEGASVAIDAHGTNAQLRNTQFVALRAKDALVDRMLARRGMRPIIDPQRPDLTISVRISRDRASVGIDLSGAPLFKRGYLSNPGKRAPIAPLRPDYAAALLASGSWARTCARARREGRAPALLTVFPGAGTVVAEAAGIAADLAPGLARYRWGFEGWAGHDAAAWDELLEDARGRLRDGDDFVTLWCLETRRGSDPSVRQMLRASGLTITPCRMEDGDVAELVACDLSWLSSDEPAVQADAFAHVAAAADEQNAPLVVLSVDDVVDAVVERTPEQVLDVYVGRDEAGIRTYGSVEEPHARPTVEVSGTTLPVYVGASDQFAKRLTKVAKQRAKWARKEDISCYRVYDADLPDYAVTIDLFEESLETARERPRRWLQMYEYAPPKGIDAALARMRLLDALAIAPRVMDVDPRNVFVRTRQRARGGSQYADEALEPTGRSRRLMGVELPAGAHLIDEGGLTFEVNFAMRLDCGIFLDHRDTRAMLREMAKRTEGSKRFLNLFAYTGTASCYAADGGMKHTTTVDMSRPSLEWARRNMERNGFSGREHEFVQADVTAWVNEQRHTANRWDLVFCDVPTFSNSQRMRKGSFGF